MMASNVVQCIHCKIVINEVLAFICNKMDVMDEESISRICTTAFSEEEIVNAKNLLFDSVTAKQRKKIRKRQGKTLRNIEDIVYLLKETDPEEIPIFVARDLQKLPPVHFDHVDVTRLLKDIVKMRNDIDRISAEYATMTDLHKVQKDLDALKNASIVNDFRFPCFVNNKRGTGGLHGFEYDSGPMGITSEYIVDKTAGNSPSKTQVSTPEGKMQKSPQVLFSPRIELPTNKQLAARSQTVTSANVDLPRPLSMTHAHARAALPQVDSARHTVSPIGAEVNMNCNKSFSAVAQSGDWKLQEKGEE